MKYISVFWGEIFMLFKCWQCGKAENVTAIILHTYWGRYVPHYL